eukprot:EG_transcript_3530
MDAAARDLQEADQHANELLPPEAHLRYAEVYARHGRLDKALVQYQRAEAQDARGQLASAILCGTAAVHQQQGNFSAAIQNHTQVLALCGEANTRQSAASLQEIGLSYYKMGDFGPALQAFQRAVEVLCRRVEAQLAPALVAGHLGMAGSFFRQKLYAQAGECAARALAAAEEQGGDALALEALLALGNVYFCLKAPAEALTHYQRALDGAERLADPRNQCRALCGAGLCYYVSGEAKGAAKVLQTALARDELVAGGAGRPPTTGEQLVDEQLLLLLHWTLRAHVTRDLLGTIYLGLTAVMMNGGGVLTPSGLPQGLLDTVIQSLAVSSDGDTMSAASARYSPHMQHYAINILQQCVRQKTLRHLVASQAVADGLWACMAFVTDTAAAGLQCHTAAYKTLKALVNCPAATVTREEACDFFLRSPKLPAVLELLPRRAKPASDARHRQAMDTLAALLAVLTAAGSVRGSGAGRLPHSSDASPIATAVCGVAKLLVGGEVFVEADLQLLELCFRLLLLLWKRVPGLKGLMARRLAPAELDAFSRAAVPPGCPALQLAADLHRLMKDHSEVRAAAGLMLRSDDALSLSGEGEDLSVLDTTTLGSVSSEASFMYGGVRPTLNNRRVSLISGVGTEDDTEDLTVAEGAEDSWMEEPNTGEPLS